MEKLTQMDKKIHATMVHADEVECNRPGADQRKGWADSLQKSLSSTFLLTRAYSSAFTSHRNAAPLLASPPIVVIE